MTCESFLQALMDFTTSSGNLWLSAFCPVLFTSKRLRPGLEKGALQLTPLDRATRFRRWRVLHPAFDRKLSPKTQVISFGAQAKGSGKPC